MDNTRFSITFLVSKSFWHKHEQQREGSGLVRTKQGGCPSPALTGRMKKMPGGSAASLVYPLSTPVAGGLRRGRLILG